MMLNKGNGMETPFGLSYNVLGASAIYVWK